MVKPYQVVDVMQGTPAWHRWRAQGFTATDSQHLMQKNLENSIKRMVEKKTSTLKSGGEVDGYQSDAMLRGIQLEPEARRAYCAETGLVMSPVCLQHTRYSWILASLDGLSPDGNRVVEIKCGEVTYESACAGKVEPRYKGQLQHILMITGLKSIDYYCYSPDDGAILIEVKRDQEYINKLRIRLIQANTSLQNAREHITEAAKTQREVVDEAIEKIREESKHGNTTLETDEKSDSQKDSHNILLLCMWIYLLIGLYFGLIDN